MVAPLRIGVSSGTMNVLDETSPHSIVSLDAADTERKEDYVNIVIIIDSYNELAPQFSRQPANVCRVI